MSFDPISYILGAKSGGGGNPNYVETITGTLDNPWGSVSPRVLRALIRSRDVTVLLSADASALGMGVANTVATPFISSDEGGIAFQAIGSTGDTVSSWKAVSILYAPNNDYVLVHARILQNDNVINATQYAATIPTTLTIIYHQLPEDNT